MAKKSFLEQSLESDEGYEVLQVVRDIRNGKVQYPDEISPRILDGLLKAEVIQGNSSRMELTNNGYILGDICKEYCNWVDNSRHMPQPKPPFEFYQDKVVLDLGCGIGRWLWEFNTAKELIGIELEKDFIEAANILSKKESKQPISIINASVEEMEKHVKQGLIDFVFCRLVFNHVYIDSTLAKTYNTLVEGGKFWLQVENYHSPLATLIHQKRMRGKMRALFAMFNTLVYMAFRKQISLKVKGRMHDVHKPVYPPSKTWLKSLRLANFKDVTVQQLANSYIFIATK